MTQNADFFKTISTLDMPGTGKLIVLAILTHKTHDVTRLMEITGEKRRTVQTYRLQWIESQDAEGATRAAECAQRAQHAQPVACDEDGTNSPHIEHGRDYTENPTGLSLSQEVQQQHARDPIEAGLLSLLKTEWNLYNDAEAKTALLGQYRAYGEKHVVDAFSNYLAEAKSGRQILKPWKFVQKTAMALRDAPAKPANVVAMAPRQTERQQRTSAFYAALKAPRVEVLS